MSERGKKYDAGKPAVYRGVLARFPRALMEIARVSEFGAEKYEVPIENCDFLEIEDCEGRYSDALVRHMLNEAIQGRVNPEDGNLLHAAQAAWDSLARLERILIDREREPGPAMPAVKLVG